MPTVCPPAGSAHRWWRCRRCRRSQRSRCARRCARCGRPGSGCRASTPSAITVSSIAPRSIVVGADLHVPPMRTPPTCGTLSQHRDPVAKTEAVPPITAARVDDAAAPIRTPAQSVTRATSRASALTERRPHRRRSPVRRGRARTDKAAPCRPSRRRRGSRCHRPGHPRRPPRSDGGPARRGAADAAAPRHGGEGDATARRPVPRPGTVSTDAGRGPRSARVARSAGAAALTKSTGRRDSALPSVPT